MVDVRQTVMVQRVVNFTKINGQLFVTPRLPLFVLMGVGLEKEPQFFMPKEQSPKETIVKSTLLQSYSYDDQNLTLSVAFKDGSNFDYFNVPPPVMSSVFDSGGSIGSRFTKQIAKRFKFVKTG